jgi:hypothetical protein
VRSRPGQPAQSREPMILLSGILSKIKPNSKKPPSCALAGHTIRSGILTASVLLYGPARWTDIFRGWMNWSPGRHMKDVLMSKIEITEYISTGEIEAIMDPEKYIGTAVEQVEAVVDRIRKVN